MKKLTKNILISASSTMIDWMDFSIFALLLPLLSKVFFPVNNITHSYLLSLSLFSVAYLSRPLGGYAFGRISDRLSHESTLKLSTLAMASCSFTAACLPTFKQAGYIGACLFLMIRLIQGIIMGGQYPTAFIILSEKSKYRYPYLISNISSMFSYAGAFIAQLFTHTLSVTISLDVMMHCGWRLLFLLSSALSTAVYFAQKKFLTSQTKRNKTVNNNDLKMMKNNFINIIFVISITFLFSAELYSATITIPNYFLLKHFITLKQSISIKSILSMSCLILTVLFAYTADIFNLKYSLLTLPSALLLIISLILIRTHIDFTTRLLQYILLVSIGVLFSATISVVHLIITQSFPPDKRNTLIGTSYGIGNSGSVLITANLVSYYCLKENSLTPDFMLLFFSSLAFLTIFIVHRKKCTQVLQINKKREYI